MASDHPIDKDTSSEAADEFDPEKTRTEPDGEPAAAVDVPATAGGTGSSSTRTGFALRAQLGRGGMGVVYRAEQEALHREVAYKAPLSAEPQHIERFLAEALVTGNLEHPNIVPVHVLGTEPSGRPFFAMKLVHGTEWSKLLHPERFAGTNADVPPVPLDLEGHLRILLAVANAVAFAHAKNILHRDLKPDNVMVGEFGEVLVMDWGIAVDLSGTTGTPRLAVDRQKSGIGGTPSYMAPEMAQADGRQLSPRTDIYLLGAILCEILTGHPPHTGANSSEVLAAARVSAPPVLSSAPPELASICLRALARDPADRHPNVKSFQHDVEGFLAHRQSLILSERASVEADALAAASADRSGGRLYDRHAQNIARFEQALDLWPANTAAKEGVRRAHWLYARAAFESGDLGLAEAQLAPLGDEPDAARLRADVRRAHDEAAAREAARERLKTVAGRLKSALAVAALLLILVLAVGFASIRAERHVAMTRLAESQLSEAEYHLTRADWTAARSAMLSSWSLFESEGDDPARARVAFFHLLDRWGQPRANVAVHDGGVTAVAFSPDGTLIASSGGKSKGRVVVRQVATGRELGVLEVVFAADPYATPRAPPLAWAPDGLTLAVGGVEPRVWDWKNHRDRWKRRADHDVKSIAFTPDGKQLAVGLGGAVALWSAVDGSPVRTFAMDPLEVMVVGVSADGRRIAALATQGPEGEARAWDLTTGAVIGRHEIRRQDVSAAAFDLDTRRVITGSREMLVRIARLDAGRELSELSGHRLGVGAVCFSRDGQRAVSGSLDLTLKVWNLRDGLVELELGAHTLPIGAVAFSPDGALIAAGDEAGAVAIWPAQRITRGMFARAPGMPGGDAVAGALDAKGSVLATASLTGVLSLWDVAGMRQTAACATEASPTAVHPCTVLAVGPGGTRVHAAFPGRLVTWDVSARSIVRHLPTSGPVAFADDRRHAVAVVGPELHVIDLDSGAPVTRASAPPGPIRAVAFTGGGNRALVAGSDLSLVELATGQVVRRYTSTAGKPLVVEQLRVSPTGRTFAYQGMGGSALVEFETGHELAELPRTMVSSIAFLPDGWFFRHDDGSPALYLHDALGVQRRVIAEDLVRYGFLARPVITPDARDVITFFHMPRGVSSPYAFHLGVADDVRAQQLSH
jgi:WD40 repeat protein